jgi:hypothetical protein
MSDLSERLAMATYRWPNGRVVARLVGAVAGAARLIDENPNLEDRRAPEPGAGNVTHRHRAHQPAVPR